MLFRRSRSKAIITFVSFFGAVTWSLAGLVVLCFAILRFDVGDLLFGRKAWRAVTGVASALFLAMAVCYPAAFMEGMDTVGKVAAKEFTETLARIAPTTTAPAPPAVGP